MGPDQDPDDNGLPPVDVDIPDDAHELDREVQAYYRELRLQRRRERRRRLLRATRRYGTTAPLMIGVLLIAALSATVLVLSSHPDGPASPTTAQNTTRGTVMPIGRPLPDIRVQVGNEPQDLRALKPAVVVVVPDRCRCQAALGHLTDESERYGVPVYLTGIKPSTTGTAELQRLADRVGRRHTPAVLDDPDGVIARTYDIGGPAAVLVQRGGRVSAVLRQLGTDTRLDEQLAPLVRR